MTEEDLMLTSLLNCRRVDLVTGSKKLTAQQQYQFDLMTKRRKKGEPLQYIIGECDFMGIPLAVDERVLIPRPETEILVELAINKLQHAQTNTQTEILDLGTGSGNIAIALAINTFQSFITAVDIDDGSLSLALKNAKRNGVARRIEFLYKDMTDYFQEVKKKTKFDMIISNPPYIATALLTRLPCDVQREPAAALDGGRDGLDYHRIILKYSYMILKSDGYLLLEIGDDQREGIESILKQYSQYNRVQFFKDYTGVDRIVAIQVDK